MYCKQRLFGRLHHSPIFKNYPEGHSKLNLTEQMLQKKGEKNPNSQAKGYTRQRLAYRLNVFYINNCLHITSHFLGLPADLWNALFLPLSSKSQFLFKVSNRYYFLNVHMTVQNTKAVTQAADCSTSIPEPRQLCHGCPCGF